MPNTKSQLDNGGVGVFERCQPSIIFFKNFFQAYSKVCLFVFFGVCLSCNDKGNSAKSINIRQNHSISVFDVFYEVDAIQIRTPDSNPVSFASNIIFHDSKILIVDYGTNKILCFSEEGDFLFQVSKQGNGKGEYNWISYITIDKEQNRIVLLDGPTQRVLFFDNDGNYLETITISTDVSLGLNEVHVLPDSLFLFAGSNENEFILYCLISNSIIERFGAIGQSTPGIFTTTNRIFHYNEECFVSHPLTNIVYQVSKLGFEPVFNWCFGRDNNTPDQIEKLKAEFPLWHSASITPIYPFIVGKGRYLNHFIMSTFETIRFRIVCLEFNGSFKNVVIDKKTGQEFVFDYFNEGLRFSPYHFGACFHIHSNMDMCYDGLIKSIESGRWYFAGGEEMKPYDLDFFYNRNHTFYTREILTERGKEVYDNHDPMHDNPYLVIFKFKE